MFRPSGVGSAFPRPRLRSASDRTRTPGVRLMTTTRRWGLLPAVAALGTLFVVPPESPVVKTDTFITAQTSGILLIEGGECFSDPTYSPGAGERIVLYTPCANGAGNQSYAFTHVPAGPYDRAALAAFGRQSCGERYAELWGGGRPDLEYFPIMPTA